MDRLPLVGGSYETRSVIASASRCINYYPEVNREDSPVPFTYYQRPGFRPLVDDGQARPVRGLWQASNGEGFACIGQTIYYIDPNFVLTGLGQLSVAGNNPISMVDNGESLVIVDGSPLGYEVDLTSHAFSQIVDGTGIFTGANRVDYIDTFVLWNIPGTRDFGSTLSNEIVFDALYIAGKAGWPDPLQTLVINRREIILLGSLKSEIWYNAGNAGFPFAELPGAYIEHGIAAKYSVATSDIETFWLGRDLQGKGVVFALKGYDCRRISNHALEFAIREMQRSVGIADAIGYTYQVDGHVFYVLTFPAGNQTWVCDMELSAQPNYAWHQRAFTDGNGKLNRDRSNCYASLYDMNVVGDWQRGTLYALDPDYYVDTVAGQDFAIEFIKGFPHNTHGTTPASAKSYGGQVIQYHKFIADLECGNGPLSADGSPAQISLLTSGNRGRSWGTAVMQSAGTPGEYAAQPQWPTMGQARDMIFELRHNIAGPAALNGAWIEATVLNN